MTLPKWLIPTIAYFLGLVFLVAGISKLFSFHEFITAVRAYGIFPEAWIPVLGFVLIVFEIALGALFFIKRYQGMAAGAASVLLTFFLALAVFSTIQGIEGECGCFGFIKSRVASGGHIVQEGILLIFSLIVYWNGYDKQRRS